MAENIIAHSFAGFDESQLQFLVTDCLMSLMRCAGRLEAELADRDDGYRTLLQRARGDPALVLDIAAREGGVTGELLALLDLVTLHSWHRGLSILLADARPAVDAHVGPPGTAGFPRTLPGAVLSALLGLAEVQEGGSMEPAAVHRAAAGLERCAELLRDDDALDDAFACVLSAINLAPWLRPAQRESATGLALELAEEGGSPDNLCFARARRVEFLVAAAEEDPGRRIEAFDAFEAAACRLPADADRRRVVLRCLQACLERAPYLHLLLPVLAAALPPDERPDGLPDLAPYQAATNPLWEGSSAEWLQQRQAFGGWLVQVENARLDAARQARARHAAGAVWADWSIFHPGLREAVPHGTSVLRERDLQNFLLVLGHEVTHVFSMVGAVGVASLAMRWALLELEITVATVYREPPYQLAPPDVLRLKGIAPLRVPRGGLEWLDVLLLAELEQTLEVARKIQVLEATWSPWFEGLAVFGEAAADPTMNALTYSPTTGVIHHLVDRQPAQLAQEWGVEVAAAVRRARDELEQMYSGALRSSGAYRLRTYLDQYAPKYQAGYLAVRAVVSAWRAALGEPLSGAEAFQVLLHATRFGAYDALPHLGLPLEEFTGAAVRLHLEWVSNLAAAAAGDLRRLAGYIPDPERPGLRFGWVKGKLMEDSDEDAIAEETVRLVERFGRETLQSLRGPLAPVWRVADADERCAHIMEVTASSLLNARAEPRMLSADAVHSMISRQLILPIGRTRAPFWLIRDGHFLACLIRTMESSGEAGAPSYDLLIFPLPEESFEELAREVEARGEYRMEVARVADLADIRLDGSGALARGDGRNLIVFRYGEWSYVQVRGLGTGAGQVDESLLDDIRARLAENPVFDAHAWVGGAQAPGARRALEWIDAVEDWTLDLSGLEVDLGPWARRLRDVAVQVLENDPPVRVEDELLRMALGDAAAARLGQHGLAPLAQAYPLDVAKLTRFLDASGRMPVQDDALDALAARVAETLGPLMARTPHGWDVARAETLGHREE
ncbi:MAG TPA: hypothetical protein VHG08_16560 [Longimicrobium sp.]|nr:hypothetical protein [Longimicrobium sp.]